MELSASTSRLRKGTAGIWLPVERGQTEAISFPEGGHGDCLAIEEDSFWFAHRNECIGHALRRVSCDGTFLDIGGGNGVVSAHLEKGGFATVLLEPGAEGAGNANRRGLPQVVCATLEEAAFAPASFAGAGLFDVIEHVEDDAALLRETHRVLKKDGVLCVTVPAHEWLWSAEDVTAGHFRRYTAQQLERLLTATGFAITYSTYIFAPLTLPLFLLRSLRYRLTRRARTDAKEAAASAHTPSMPLRLVMDTLLAPELRAVERGLSIPVGTTCLAVARKQ